MKQYSNVSTMVTMFNRTGLFIFLIALPFFAHAETSTVWDFRGSMPGDWRETGIKAATKTEVGLLIQTDKVGSIQRDSDFDHSIDTVKIKYLSEHNSDAILLWHERNTPSGYMVQLPFQLKKSELPTSVELNVGAYKQWNPRADRIGIRFPSGTNLLIQSVEFSGNNILEKTAEAWKTFWTFDLYRPTSINFLWGPLLTYSTAAREQLFQSQTPLAHSANRAFYIILGTALIVLIFQRLRTGRRSAAAFFAIFAALWLFFDLRMGLEFFGYLKYDYTTYINREPGERTFRERMDFYDFMEAAVPYVEDRDHYIFSSRYPLVGLSRYYTYPSLPVQKQENADLADTLLIFDQPKLIIDEKERIVSSDGQVLSNPGKILYRFNDTSFVFRQTP